MTIKKTLHLIVLPMLLVISAALILVGALLPRHELYYPALFFLMLSGVLEALELSLCWQSQKGFALSLLNLFILVGLAVQHLLENFPVIAAKDWHLGITIMLLYILVIGVYAYFFRKKLPGSGGHMFWFIVLAVLPLIAAGLFYLGVKAWIGLVLLTTTVAVGGIMLRNRMTAKKKPD